MNPQVYPQAVFPNRCEFAKGAFVQFSSSLIVNRSGPHIACLNKCRRKSSWCSRWRRVHPGGKFGTAFSFDRWQSWLKLILTFTFLQHIYHCDTDKWYWKYLNVNGQRSITDDISMIMMMMMMLLTILISRDRWAPTQLEDDAPHAAPFVKCTQISMISYRNVLSGQPW